MRARTTWNTNEILSRTAATTRTADPYAMNQDHVKQQPPADKYLTGDPSAFAEDITTPNNWEVEYAGGAVKRNEIGLPEDRPDTYNHPEKTAALNHEAVVKKADLTVRIARRMLGANATETAIEDQAAALMNLPDADVINTYNRLANEVPPQFKEQQQQQQAAKQQEANEAQEQAKQAALRGDMAGVAAALARYQRIANDQPQQGQPQQQQANQQPAQQPQQQAQTQQQGQAQQQSAWYDTKAPRPGHPGPDTGPYAGQAQGQGQVPPPAFQQQQSGLTNPQTPSPNLQQQSGQQQFPGGQQWGDGGHQWANQQVPPPAPQQQQAQTQQAPAQTVESQVQQMIEQAAQQIQAKQANDPQQGQPQQQQANQQAPAQQPQQQQAGQQGQPQQGQPQQQQAQQQPAQQPQQQQAQVQQQANCPPMQQQAQGLVNPNQGVSPNYAGQQVQASDDHLLDQMLMGPGGAAGAAPGGPIAELDIQMEAPTMDIGDVTFAPGEDDMLKSLFASDEAQAAQQAQEAQQQGQGQQQVQAANIRTAAMRTVGTRPTAGVARIGGAGAAPSRDQDVNRLSSLWQTAPDVREVFGLRTT